MKLKILSLNIFEGGLFFENILNFIRREQPDVLCLQEVYNGTAVTLPDYYQSINTIKTAFPEYQYYFSPELLAITIEGKLDLGNAIFSKYPIVESSAHFFNIPYGEHPQIALDGDWSKDPHNIQHSVINVDGTKVNIFNAHGVWGFDGTDNDDRLFMSKVIVDQIKDKEKAILVGDFNAQAETKTIGNIEKHMVNVFKGELKTSFNLKHKDLVKSPGYATAVVDMFFVSPDVKVLTKSVPTDDVSDHLPLLCEVEV